MAAGTRSGGWRGADTLAIRLLASLTAAGVGIVAFAAVAYLQVVVPIDDPAVRSSVTSGFIGVVLAAIISLVLVGVTFGSNTAITLQLLSAKAKRIEDGDMDVTFETERGDEIGELARSLAGMRDALQQRIEAAERRRRESERLNDHLERKARHYNEVLQEIMEGDLSRRVDPDSENEAVEEIGEAINLTISELETATTAIAREMENLSATAEEVAASADDLAGSSSRAAEAGTTGREAAAAALEETNDLEAEAKTAVERIETLEEEIEEIEEIVRVIGEIAQKTNILAVNARIESSRSDEGGHGYSIVADEVRDLAEETKAAAEDIERRIERVQERTSETAAGIRSTGERMSQTQTAVRRAGDALDEVADLVDDVDRAVQNIDAATDDQAETAQSVAEMVEALATLGEGASTADLDDGGFDFGAAADRQPDATAGGE